MKRQLSEAQLKLTTMKDKWKNKLRNLDIDLSSTKDKVFVEKMKQCQVMQHQLDEAQQAVADVKYYTDSLEEMNDELKNELKQALEEKRAAMRLTAKVKQLAANRLDKWHKERKQRRKVED